MMKSQWRVDRNQNTFSARTIICVVLFVKVMAEISDRRNNDFNRLGVPKDGFFIYQYVFHMLILCY